MALGDIPLQVETGALTGSAPAVLREIVDLLERLDRGEEGGSIDLRGLPLSPADRHWLRDRLGRGEVEIVLAIGGESRIVETATPGVWWVVHGNDRGGTESEFIEVARVPTLLPPDKDEIAAGLEVLKTRISELY